MSGGGESAGRDGRRRSAAREAAAYAAAALVPVGVIASVMRIWRAGLSTPYAWGSDSLLTQATVKGWLTGGSFWVNPSLGAPGVSELYEMPGADLLHWVELRLLGLAGADWASAINLLYLIGYAAVGVAALYALRRLGVSRTVGSAAAVLFSLLPFHWMRGEGHLFLSNYWVVPLVVLVAAWLDAPDSPLLSRDADGRARFDLRAPRSIAAMVICAAAAMSGVYFAFFGCFLLVAAGVRAALRERDRRVLVPALLLVVLIAVILVAQVAPSVVYNARNGRNPDGLVRNPGQAEVYGLKITQMFLPIDSHRIAVLARLKAAYRAGLRQMGPYLDNESDMAALGVVGALGFLLSAMEFVFGLTSRARPREGEGEGQARGLMPLFGFLNVCAVLLATVGGFGAMLAVVIPQIRGYNRISVFIGFISLAFLAVAADRWMSARPGGAWRAAGAAAIVLVVIAGVLDQTPASLGDLSATEAAVSADARWVAEVRGQLPAGAAVFQLPYMPFPEPGGPIHKMNDYDPLKGYLLSSGLRWSYGAMKGRSTDAWQRATSGLPVPAMLAEVRAKGFTGLWVQLDGYGDGGRDISQRIEDALDEPPTLSADGRFAFWRM